MDMKKTTQHTCSLVQKIPTNQPQPTLRKKTLPTEENSHYNQKCLTCHLPHHMTLFTTTTLNPIDLRLGQVYHIISPVVHLGIEQLPALLPQAYPHVLSMFCLMHPRQNSAASKHNFTPTDKGIILLYNVHLLTLH